jgi:hypothetical protein
MEYRGLAMVRPGDASDQVLIPIPSAGRQMLRFTLFPYSNVKIYEALHI